MFWWPCCQGGCPIFADNFNRANSTNLGGNWDERSGSWEINGNRLKETAGNGIVICTVPDPDQQPCDIEVFIPGGVINGVCYRVIVNYVDDNNYLFAQYCAGADGFTDTISVNQRVAGAETQLKSIAATRDPNPATERIWLCRNMDGLYAGTAQTPNQVWACLYSADNGGRKAGLGISGGTAAFFDNFTFTNQLLTTPSECRYCRCACGDYCLPETLTLTFTSNPSEDAQCQCLDGDSMTLTLDSPELANCTWSGTATLSSWYCSTPTYTWQFMLSLMDEGNCLTWKLCRYNEPDDYCPPWPDDPPCAVNATQKSPESCQCNPFQLIFTMGPCQEAEGAPLCNFTITITK